MQQASAMEEIRNNQLPGMRFCPMEDELLLSYLKPMLSGQNVPGRNKVVFDCDLYGQQEPWEIWEAYKTKRPNDLRLHKDLYFFTQHKKMKSTDKRIRRTVGSGTWKGNDSGNPVKSSGREIGLKKRFTYENKKSKHHGCWILHEFYLDRSLRDKKEKVKDYVLCLLRKNGDSKTKIEKKRKQREEEDVLDACDDGEQSNTEQEELLETQAKRQRTVCAPPVPTLSEVDAFVAELEGSMECVQDDNSPPSEADAIGFQGVEDGGLQQLALEVQSGPSFVPLPEEDFLMEQCFEELSNYEEREQDPAGSNNVCGPPVPTPSEVDAIFIAELEGSMECVQNDFSRPSKAEAIGFQGVEDGGLQQLGCEVQSGPSFVPLPEEDFLMEQCFEELRNYEETEEQDPAGSNNICGGLIDHNSDDWINSISFSPEDNDFVSREMLSSFFADTAGLP
ncbi:hypothetical protein ACLB2K_054850 [Fragaria x ananassa]